MKIRYFSKNLQFFFVTNEFFTFYAKIQTYLNLFYYLSVKLILHVYKLLLQTFEKTLRHLTVRRLEKLMRIKYVVSIRTSRRRLYLHKYHEESQVYSHFGCMFVRNKIYWYSSRLNPSSPPPSIVAASSGTAPTLVPFYLRRVSTPSASPSKPPAATLSHTPRVLAVPFVLVPLPARTRIRSTPVPASPLPSSEAPRQSWRQLRNQ